MTYQIFEASPQALAKITEEARAKAKPAGQASSHHRAKYPFDELALGQCFTVPISEANEFSLRMGASSTGKKLGKKFCVLKHRDFACIEVARIA